MLIKLTAEALRAIFPRAPQAVIDAFVAKQDVLTRAGINATRNRLAFFFANIEHECGGFTIPNLTENINYTAARMAQVWPGRFKGGATAVQAKYGTGKGWQTKAFNDIYGNRMGNRPGTSDGSTYIGRGGPQWTGRDGYTALERLTGLPAVMNPEIASRLDMQPEICAAFWTWKNLNRFADANDFLGCVKAWNGGTNGMADRQHLMAGNDPILKRLESVATVTSAMPEAKKPAVSKEDVGKAAAVAVVSIGGATGAHQGWGVTGWLIAIGMVLAIAAAIGLGVWLWRRHKAAPASYHDRLIAGSNEAKGTAAAALPSPASVWTPNTVAPFKPAAKRKARKAPARKAAARKNTERKAA